MSRYTSCSQCPHLSRLLTPTHPFWCTHPARKWQDIAPEDGYPLPNKIETSVWSECPYHNAGTLTDEQLVETRDAHLDRFHELAKHS